MEGSIILWIIAAVLAVFGIIAIAKPSKPDTKKVMNWIGAFALVLALFFGVWQWGLLAGLGLSPLAPVQTGIPQIPQLTVTQTPQNQVSGTLCAIEDTTVTLSATDKFTAVAAGTTHKYRKSSNGVTWGSASTVSDLGTFTASPYDWLDILYGNESDASYFGLTRKVQVPCKGTFDPAEIEPVLLYANGTATLTVYTEGGDVIDGTTYNETLGVGDVANLKIELRASNQKGFPHGGVLSLELNKSDFDEEKITLSLSGLTLTSTTAPTIDTLGNVGNTIVAWKVSAFEGTELHVGTLTLDVDGTYNPANTNDPIITFYPNDYYVDEDKNGAYSGPAVEDEDRAQTFSHTTTTTVHIA